MRFGHRVQPKQEKDPLILYLITAIIIGTIVGLLVNLSGFGVL